MSDIKTLQTDTMQAPSRAKTRGMQLFITTTGIVAIASLLLTFLIGQYIFSQFTIISYRLTTIFLLVIFLSNIFAKLALDIFQKYEQ